MAETLKQTARLPETVATTNKRLPSLTIPTIYTSQFLKQYILYQKEPLEYVMLDCPLLTAS